MPQVHRLGDICTGHGCWPPRPNCQASPNVHANSIPIHRQSDAWNVHCLHGSEEVFILGKGFVPIRELLDLGLPQGSKTFTEILNKRGLVDFIESEITGLYFKGYSSEFIRIHTGTFTSSLVTPDHLIFYKGEYFTALEIHKHSSKFLNIISTEHVTFDDPQEVYDLRVDNEYDEHNFLVKSGLYLHNCCGPACHGGNLASGSPNVWVNNLQMARKGDPVTCGSNCATHSPNVWAN